MHSRRIKRIFFTFFRKNLPKQPTLPQFPPTITARERGASAPLGFRLATEPHRGGRFAAPSPGRRRAGAQPAAAAGGKGALRAARSLFAHGSELLLGGAGS